MLPTGPFARVRQARRPESVEFKLLIKLIRQPAGSPLPRPVQFHALKPHLHAIALGMFGHAAIGGEQCQLPIFLIIYVERLDHPAPGLTLIVIDLAEVEHRPLHHLAASAALAFHYAPIAVLFTVFDPARESQVHAIGFYGDR
jgi:hypothetical protein